MVIVAARDTKGCPACHDSGLGDHKPGGFQNLGVRHLSRESSQTLSKRSLQVCLMGGERGKDTLGQTGKSPPQNSTIEGM